MLRVKAVAAFLVISACGGGQSCPDQPQAARVAPDRGGGPTGPSDCPMNQLGVDVTVTDVQEGAMLTMKSPPESVDRVRALGRHIETVHARRVARHGDLDGSVDGTMMVPAAAVVAEDIENGIRLVFIAEDPATVEKLRSRARAQAERIRTAECPKMPPPGPTTPQPGS